jgi:hypothetical protein
LLRRNFESAGHPFCHPGVTFIVWIAKEMGSHPSDRRGHLYVHGELSRILLLFGILRVMSKGERITGGLNKLDRVLIAWGVWTICSSYFHNDILEALVFRFGMVLNTLGFYFLMRVFIQDRESFLRVCKIIIIALLPIAIEMAIESRSGTDLFAMLGGVSRFTEMRGGKVRAQGPFAHPILAGTVGAACLPLAILFWKSNRKLALLGLAVTSVMVLASRSSGPIMTAFFAVFGLCLWKFRNYMRLLRWSTVLGIILLAMVMNAPVYFIVDRFNLTGHSTGWHRAFLIQSAITHVDDWWLGGTDYTRNWTPDAGADPNNTDITNHYIRMAVWGGMPMLLLFVWGLAIAFMMVSGALRANKDAPFQERFLLWTLGCILFGHAASMISVSYFDQSVFFLYFVLAAISTLQAVTVTEENFAGEPVLSSQP